MAAPLGRGADGGAAVGLVLLAVSPAAGLRHGVEAGGLLAAALTVPRLLGPWVARRLDRARDGRRVLAAAFAAYGIALAAASLGSAASRWRSSSPRWRGRGVRSTPHRRPRQPARGHRRQRAAREGWDAVTYGLAGTLGPALVAVLASVATPLAAMLTLAAAAVVAAAVTLTLPRAEPSGSRRGRDALTVRAALRLLVAHGPLRRVGVATMLAAASFGALSVVAVCSART